MTLDKLQTRFVDEVLHGDTHLILTGRAGTGKSTALVSAVRAAQAAQMDVLVMAPTAMAASIHRDAGLESGTIHHALRWNPAKEPLPRKLLSVCGTHTDWAATPDQDRLLVVDEASMVGLWLFEILARDLGDPERPFDGRRLVVVGDWAQLPPVVGPDEQNMAMPELKRFGPPDGCIFFHPLFCRRPPVSIILEETHRANGAWFESLNLLRECSRPSNLLTFGIAPPQHTQHDEDAVHMCFRRVTAHNRNAECLARLPGRPHFLPLRDGQAELKEGCDVIVTSNRAGGNYINGSRATFSGVNEKGEVILDDGNALKDARGWKLKGTRLFHRNTMSILMPPNMGETKPYACSGNMAITSNPRERSGFRTSCGSITRRGRLGSAPGAFSLCPTGRFCPATPSPSTRPKA